MRKWSLDFENGRLEHQYRQNQEEIMAVVFQYLAWLIIAIVSIGFIRALVNHHWILAGLLAFGVLVTLLFKTRVKPQLIPLLFAFLSIGSSLLVPTAILYSGNHPSISSIDISHFISIELLLSSNVLLNQTCILVFIVARVVLYINQQLYIPIVQLLALSVFLFVKDYLRIRSYRRQYLTAQWNSVYEQMIDFFIQTDALVVATFDKCAMKFVTQLTTLTQLQHLPRDANELFKLIHLDQFKIDLQTYLYRTYVAENAAKEGQFREAAKLQEGKTRCRVEGMVTYLEEQRFMVAINKQQHRKRNQALLKQLVARKTNYKNVNNLFQAEMHKMLVYSILKNLIEPQPRHLTKAQLIRLIKSIRRNFTFDVAVQYMKSDPRYIHAFLLMAPKGSFILMHPLDDQKVYLGIQTNAKMTQKLYNVLSLIISHISISGIKQIWNYPKYIYQTQLPIDLQERWTVKRS